MCLIYVVFLIFSLLMGGGIISSFGRDKTMLLKAIMPFFIIIQHSKLFPEDFEFAGIYVVTLFFFVSGYGLEAKRSIKGVCFRELHFALSKLYIPIIVPAVLYSLLLFVIEDISLGEYFHSLLRYNVILPYTWFVLTLSILYIVFYTACGFLQDKFHILIAVSSVLMVFSILGFAFGVQATYHISCGGFIAGIAYRMFEARIVCCLSKFKHIRVFLLMILFFLTWLSLQHFSIPEYPRIYVQSMIWAALIVMIISCSPEINNPVVTFLGKISYELYLCQAISFLLVSVLTPLNVIALLAVLIVNVMIAMICNNLTKVLVNVR